MRSLCSSSFCLWFGPSNLQLGLGVAGAGAAVAAGVLLMMSDECRWNTAMQQLQQFNNESLLADGFYKQWLLMARIFILLLAGIRYG
jgi:hypothetical protein